MTQERETVVTVVTKGPAEAADEHGPACLVVYYGQNIGRRYFLDKSELIVGRSASANIQVDQDSVSRQHAKLAVRDGCCTVHDLGSTNGTYVNDRPVAEGELRDGDLVRIGQTIFKYLSGSNIEAKYHEEIYRLTTMDGLTQSFNRRYFVETLERELKRAQRYGRSVSLIMIDIDHFKKINDAHGHLAGDFVLREMASVVAANLRREDVFARYGGEEFAVLLPEIDHEGAAQVAEKLRKLVAEHSYRFGGQLIAVTISLGVRTLREAEQELDANGFIGDADAKLYEAKQGGRNRVCA